MINILDKATIDKIAAGEVVERPASIVKELLENSIDAKAKQITVEIKDGGISFIRITDDGEGISKEDVKKAFLRHATSKIQNAEDLENILSLGFRGEALSSISAVSKSEIITKRRQDFSATLYKIEGGIEKEYQEVAAPDGTTIIIKDLFFNTPARRKFLKSPNAENAVISDIIEKLALSHPDISFRYISNNTNKLHTLGNSKLKDVIYQIYKKEAALSLLNVEYQDDIFKINGFIAKPEFSKAKRNGEIYFINARYIKNDIIYKAIEDGYGNRLMQGKYPFVVLNIDMNPSLIDVNVHPAKMEVRFEEINIVYSVIKSLVENTLLNADLVKRAYICEKSRQNEIKKELFEKFKLENSIRYPENFEKNRIRESLEEKESDKTTTNIDYKNLYLKDTKEKSQASYQDFLNQSIQELEHLKNQEFLIKEDISNKEISNNKEIFNDQEIEKT